MSGLQVFSQQTKVEEGTSQCSEHSVCCLDPMCTYIGGVSTPALAAGQWCLYAIAHKPAIQGTLQAGPVYF